MTSLQQTTITNSKKENTTNNDSTKQRKWIIIEDFPKKAKYFIANILTFFPNDAIYWLFPETNEAAEFDFLTYVDKNIGCFKLTTKEDNKWVIITGSIFFYWSKSEMEFVNNFDFVAADGNGIILLDVKLPSVLPNDSEDIIHPTLKKKMYEFLTRDDPRKIKPLISIMSQSVAYGMVKEAIKEDHRIFAPGGRWSFTKPQHFVEFIKETAAEWDKHHSKPPYAIEDFLKDMAKLSQHDCHNWREEEPSELRKYIKKGTWNTEWSMPIQLGYLIKLLKYEPKKFVKTFELKNSKGYFIDGHSIGECLKIMGTKDKNTYSFSLLGATFIAWAAYRRHFPHSEGNKLFIKAVKTLGNKNIARYKLISPPQQNETLQTTVTALFKMIFNLTKSTIEEETGKDLLTDVELDSNGLRITINIHPENLQKKIQGTYQNRFLTKNVEGGGESTTKILDYIAQSNFCDNFVMGRKPFIGSPCPLTISAAGDYKENGILLNFKYGT